MLGVFNEVQIEFLIVTGSLISMALCFIVSVILLVGNSRSIRKSNAAFNAGIVFLMLSIIFLVIALLMWMFYPSYFTNVIRAMFTFS